MLKVPRRSLKTQVIISLDSNYAEPGKIEGLLSLVTEIQKMPNALRRALTQKLHKSG
jgi:hypothetical protein